jgi:hypothetical protein
VSLKITMNIRAIIREEIGHIFNGKKSTNVEYTGVILEGDEILKFESQLSNRLEDLGIKVPSDFKKPGNYHMTITLGELSLSMKMGGAIGSPVELTCHSIGVSDDAMAVGVSGLFSRNEIQHITVAFKTRPSDSKDIVNWIEFEPFAVTGYVREITNKNFDI